MNTIETHERFTRLWTEAQPIVAAYLSALVPDFQEAEDLNVELGGTRRPSTSFRTAENTA